jgi:hypothetical protein
MLSRRARLVRGRKLTLHPAGNERIEREVDYVSDVARRYFVADEVLREPELVVSALPNRELDREPLRRKWSHFGSRARGLNELCRRYPLATKSC